MRRWVLSTLVLAAAVLPTAAQELIDLPVGPHVFRVEVADDPDERRRGLMFRTRLDPDHGMLFVFPDAQLRSFWMVNTAIPLSIAYIGADGVIQEIHDMQPFSRAPVPSRAPAMYALEVNQGRFQEVGVRVRDRIDLSALR